MLCHRNGQILVNRLPPETFTSICGLALPPLDPESTAPNNERVFSVMKLTHVCKHWRSALISSPALWTNFFVLDAVPKFVAECLQRSQQLPIHVAFKWDSDDPDYDSPSNSVVNDDGSVVDDDGDTSEDDGNAVSEDGTDQTSSSELQDSDDGSSSHSTLSVYPDHFESDYSWTSYIKEAQSYYQLIQQSHRIATLDISFAAPGDDEDEDENPFACGLLFYPLPALQTLRLRFDGKNGTIPQAILDEHITAVKSLLLKDIVPTQIMDLPLNVTSLTLTATSRGTTIDADSFLRFLGKNQNLRSLTLDNQSFSPVSESVAPVVLSNLRELDFSSQPITFLRHLAAPPLGPQSCFTVQKDIRWNLSSSAENSTTGTSTSVSSFLLSANSNPDELLSIFSGVFGTGWEEATRVVVGIPVGGWEREFVDKFLARLTKLRELFVECRNGRVDLWFDSLAAPEERCPNLKHICFDVAQECLVRSFKSVRKLVEQRAEVETPLEVVERSDPSPIWDDLYERWRIDDYLKKRDP